MAEDDEASVAGAADDGAPSGALDETPDPPVEPDHGPDMDRVARPAPHDLAGPIAIAAIVLVVDQITKAWAQHALADGHTVHLVGSLRLNLIYNSGMAFSRGRGLGPVIGVLALVLIVVMLASLRREGSRAARVALGLVIGGAAGNIVDRLVRGGGFLRGRVIDFLDAQFWPVFNVADIAVSVGGVVLALGALRSSHLHKRHQAARSETARPETARPETAHSVESTDGPNDPAASAGAS